MTARIDVVGLVTSDPARTVSFYRALGFEVPALTENGHLDLALGEITLMIDTETVMTSFDPRWAQGSAGRLSLAAHCDTPDEVDHLHKVLRQLGSGPSWSPSTHLGVSGTPRCWIPTGSASTCMPRSPDSARPDESCA